MFLPKNIFSNKKTCRSNFFFGIKKAVWFTLGIFILSFTFRFYVLINYFATLNKMFSF